MQAFSSTVRDMYALAEYASPDQFLTRAIGLMQMWIRFDGAIFGTGEGNDPGVRGMLSSASAAGASLPASMAGDAAGLAGVAMAASAATAAQRADTSHRYGPTQVAGRNAHASRPKAADDPVAQGYRNAPLSPTRGGIRVLYRKGRDARRAKQGEVSSFRTLADELGMCHLMLHGDDPGRVKPARWIVLYRQHDVRFAESDAAALHGLWVHLSRALAINRARAVERLQGAQSHRDASGATALIDDEGQVEIADQRFFDLLEREWPELSPEFIPHEAMEVLEQGKPYRGAQVEITLIKEAGCNLCRIRPIDAMEVLTPREFVVARRFAAGMSHKQIARELGVSHHTVRNQLAHLYRKLNLHDKASLAQYLSANLGTH